MARVTRGKTYPFKIYLTSDEARVLNMYCDTNRVPKTTAIETKLLELPELDGSAYYIGPRKFGPREGHAYCTSIYLGHHANTLLFFHARQQGISRNWLIRQLVRELEDEI